MPGDRASWASHARRASGAHAPARAAWQDHLLNGLASIASAWAGVCCGAPREESNDEAPGKDSGIRRLV